jgi:hypothetical protein
MVRAAEGDSKGSAAMTEQLSQRKRLTNAEKQAAWRARRDEELRNLRARVWELEKRLRNLAEGTKRRKFHLNPAKRKNTAYHEAGHAVIALAVQLPVAYACSVPSGRAQVGHVAMGHRSTRSIGPGYRLVGDRYKRTVTPKAAELDAFGNVPRKISRAAAEHHAEVIMCMAGPMADAKVSGDSVKWRDKASNSDMQIARFHRSELGEGAKSWEQYEQEAQALVDKCWPMIEAVSSRLMKVDWISGSEVDDICGRVARQQYARKLRNPAQKPSRVDKITGQAA